ncbi:HD domain-containing protein [Streptomyces sp. 1331.2]|uniref:HD domain-containing protein n=1 Tax=Streptomyces sp. 1331.2 TaxID=1938835 RepID=UPI000BDD2532|nr:ATP-binding protein [Streptomyces sp. 1331.2]SOB85335.1 hypothetical protein SAMN06272789_5618 [Streptomyces sp. 1331.2]
MVDSSNTMNGTVHGDAVQAGYIGNVYLDGRRPPAVKDGDDPWVRIAAESRAWQHVRAGRDAETYRRAALAAVRRLARLRDAVDRADDLADDPWQDPGIAVRFASRVGWLLGDGSLDLYPAEAALLAVVPFLYRVRSLQLAAARTTVRPTDLRPTAAPEGDRAAYEQFIESYDLLTHRTRTRPDSAAPIGWWLYHRWLDQHEDLADPEGVREILDRLPVLDELGETFALKRICALLHGLRRGPDVTNRDYLAGLREDDHLRAPGEQHVREPRLALILALAYGTAIETTALPDIVAEHLGIPHEVDLADLRETLELAVWGGSYDLPVLRAECRHEAVVEGLREYTARADELLHAVRRVLVGHPLPTRLTSDEAAPAAGAFTGWARFRLDERRVRSLLMGVELYRDRDLAVRELYQNALDACRYRRARTEYLDRTNTLGARFTYDGRIDFRQSVDHDGRAYLECEDNGVGMGESELRGVFSNAGARFAEQLDFKLERAEWRKADPPVELYPNSRFGIGVLSYFMLADEIQVTTCRMDATGRIGPRLEVSIYGPSHLFRITEREDSCRKPGTTVRLYLRDDIDLEETWSALDVLERLLGVAEFRTTVAHGERGSVWEPGVFRPRSAPESETFGLDAHGVTVSWKDAPDGAHVVWCEEGGALLVDGLLVEPEVRRGVFSPWKDSLAGAVVNLSGRFAPGKMSVDRRRVIDDTSGTVGALLAEGAGELVRSDSGLFGMEWVGRLTDDCIQLADLVAAEAVRQGCRLTSQGIAFDLGRAGLFPADRRILGYIGIGLDPEENRRNQESATPSDHVLLWRLMAHGRTDRLERLAGVSAMALATRDIRLAKPSDSALLITRGSRRQARTWRESVSESWLAEVAAELGLTHEQVRERAAALGLEADDERVSPSGGGEAALPIGVAELFEIWKFGREPMEAVVERLTSRGVVVSAEVSKTAAAMVADPVLLLGGKGLSTFGTPFERDGSVAPGYLAKASSVLGISTSEACAAFAKYGIAADATGLPDFPSSDDVRSLSVRLNGTSPWLNRSKTASVVHVLQAAATESIGVADVIDRLTAVGIPVPSLPADASAEDVELFRDKAGGFRWFDSLSYGRLFAVVGRGVFTLQEAIDRYRTYGFHVPMNAPEVNSLLDFQLLSGHGPMKWPNTEVGSVVPFADLIMAASATGRNPEELVARLKACGIPVSTETLPADVSLREAEDLVRSFARSSSRPSSLALLLREEDRLGRSARQIHSWLHEWGVVDRDLADVVRAALARVPVEDPS